MVQTIAAPDEGRLRRWRAGAVTQACQRRETPQAVLSTANGINDRGYIFFPLFIIPSFFIMPSPIPSCIIFFFIE